MMIDETVAQKRNDHNDGGELMPDTTLEARDFAKAIALDMAEDPSDVGDFVTSQDLGDGVTDFRFESHIAGYEGWQWSVTMYHDEELDHWTVNESSLLPTEQALLPPKWIPWKDRLEPTDLSVTDSIGTDPDDPRLEEGLTDQQIEAVADAIEKEQQAADEAATATTAETDDAEADSASAEPAGAIDVQNDAEPDAAGKSTEAASDATDTATTSALDMAEAIDEFELSRRHVLSSLGRAQTAKRWYEGPHGPKALSTKTAGGSVCETCGFFIPLKGDLSRMFGVCANKWSPDDGRVVSLDHGCGEHSEIDPPQPSRLWVQSKPAFDDLHIDIVAQKPREEHGEVELLERLSEGPEPEADATEPDAQEPAGESTEDHAAERAADAESAETAEVADISEPADIVEPVETAESEAGEDSVEPSKEETGEAGETDEEGEATVGTDGREQTADAEDEDATVSIPVNTVPAHAEDAGHHDAAEQDESDDEADEATEEDIDAQTVPDDEATDEDIAEHAADHGSDDDDDADTEEDGPEVVETVDLTER